MYQHDLLQLCSGHLEQTMEACIAAAQYKLQQAAQGRTQQPILWQSAVILMTAAVAT